MNGPFRTVGMITMCCYLSGCSTYCKVPWSPGDPGTESGSATEDCDVKTGDSVRLILVDGDKIKGRLESLDRAGVAIYLGSIAEAGEEPQYFPRDEVVTLEKVGTDGVATGVIVAGVTVLLVGVIMLGKSMEGLGEIGGS